jgi:hypothetical protein
MDRTLENGGIGAAVGGAVGIAAAILLGKPVLGWLPAIGIAVGASAGFLIGPPTTPVVTTSIVPGNTTTL